MKRTINIGIQIVFFAVLFYTSPTYSQNVPSRSDNYWICKDDSSFKYFYKVESKFNESWVYYEMGKKSGKSKKIEVKTVDMTGTPLPHSFLRVKVNENSQELYSDSNGATEIILPTDVYCIEIDIQARKKYLLINDGFIPSKMTIIYGDPANLYNFMNIRSRKQLKFNEINKIRSIVLSGGRITDDNVFYYHSGD